MQVSDSRLGYFRSARPLVNQERVEEEILESTANKVDNALKAVSGTGTSLARSFNKGNEVQVAAEAIKVVGSSIKQPVVKDSLVKTSTVVSGVAAAANGDAFAAASAAKAALSKSPALNKLEVVADAVLLATGEAKIGESVEKVKEQVETLASEHAPAEKKWQSALDLAQTSQGGIILGTELYQAASGVGRVLGKVEAAAPAVASVQGAVGTLARSPVGWAARGLTKVVPLLNVAALAGSVKATKDVFKDTAASTTSKALAIGSVVSGTVLLGASLMTGGAALILPAAVAGIGVELGLIQARRNDAKSGDTDEKVAEMIENPVDTLKLAGDLAKEGVEAIGRRLDKMVDNGIDKLKRAF